METVPDGQLNSAERQLLTDAVLKAAKKPEVIIEIGTWLGGGSTITFLQALQINGIGHLWGIEANRDVYDRMMANLKARAPEVLHRFTPLFGFSQQVLPKWIAEQKKPFEIDIAFLDGENRPSEQIEEFHILDPYLPVGAQLWAHDAKFRKGKWFVPFISLLDNWDVHLHDVSNEGLLGARKIALQPGPESLKAAQDLLKKMRSQPIEILARLAPDGLKRMAFSVMPRRLAARIADGRK